MKFTKKVTEPTCFGNYICDCTIFCFGTGARSCRLSADHDIRLSPRKNTITRCGSSSIRATSPVSICVSDKLSRSGRIKTQTKNTFESIKMRNSWCMREKTHLLNRIGDVRPCKRKVLKCTS